MALEAIEVWFADEARVGQKNKITADGLSAARAERSQRSANGLAYILGAICLKDGKGAALVMPDETRRR